VTGERPCICCAAWLARRGTLADERRRCADGGDVAGGGGEGDVDAERERACRRGEEGRARLTSDELAGIPLLFPVLMPLGPLGYAPLPALFVGNVHPDGLGDGLLLARWGGTPRRNPRVAFGDGRGEGMARGSGGVGADMIVDGGALTALPLPFRLLPFALPLPFPLCFDVLPLPFSPPVLRLRGPMPAGPMLMSDIGVKD